MWFESPFSMWALVGWAFKGPIYVFSITIYVFLYCVLKDLYYCFIKHQSPLRSHFQEGGAGIVARMPVDAARWTFDKKAPGARSFPLGGFALRHDATRGPATA